MTFAGALDTPAGMQARTKLAQLGSNVVVGDQGSFNRDADEPVVPDAGVEREQPLDDAGPQPGGDAPAVAFEAELVLQGPDDGLDPLPQPVRERSGLLLVLAGRADQGQAEVLAGEELLGFLPDRPLSVTTAVPGSGRFAGCRSSVCRAWSRSPCNLGLARLNPVTVPSQVQISSSLHPQ